MPKPTDHKPFHTDVIHCARCGGNHTEVFFRPFTRPLQTPTEVTHFALCPSNQEPILMQIKPAEPKAH